MAYKANMSSYFMKQLEIYTVDLNKKFSLTSSTKILWICFSTTYVLIQSTGKSALVVYCPPMIYCIAGFLHSVLIFTFLAR